MRRLGNGELLINGHVIKFETGTFILNNEVKMDRLDGFFDGLKDQKAAKGVQYLELNIDGITYMVSVQEQPSGKWIASYGSRLGYEGSTKEAALQNMEKDMRERLHKKDLDERQSLKDFANGRYGRAILSPGYAPAKLDAKEWDKLATDFAMTESDYSHAKRSRIQAQEHEDRCRSSFHKARAAFHKALGVSDS